MSIVLLIAGLLLFIGLVVIHEFGHFLTARRNGVEVEEFGIGFPPRAWGKKTKEGFIFSLNWLPVGGFVKLKGETDAATEKGTLGAASIWAKAKIMLAGVAMNFIVAFILLTFLAIVGMPQLIDNQYTYAGDTKVARSEVLIGTVEKDSPASKAGLAPRDRLVSVASNGKTYTVKSASQLPSLTKTLAGKNITLGYERKGQPKTINLTLRDQKTVEVSKKTDHPKGYLGISPTEFTLTRSTWSAPIVALRLMWQFTAATFQGLGTAIAALFHGNGSKAAEQVSGPVGIIVILKDGSLLGYEFVLMIIAIISLTLALMNILPIPALDGGRLYMMLLSQLSLKYTGKRMSEKTEETVVGISFIALLSLIVLITVVDVRRFF